MKRKKLPILAVIGLDALLFVSILFTFCYFHHIRMLWGDMGGPSGPSYVKPSREDPSSSESYHLSEKVTVPSVLGHTPADAEVILAGAGLGQIEFVFTDSDTEKAGTVIDQSISAGETVDRDSKITLTVSSGSVPFSMPEALGKPVGTATELLRSLGLNVTLVYEKTEEAEEGTVLFQSIEEGTEVQKGTGIYLTVATAKEVQDIPNVVNKTKEEGISLLETAGFKVVVIEEYSNEFAAGLLWAQSPKAGYRLPSGETVQVTVSLGKQPVRVKLNPTGGILKEKELTVFLSDSYGALPAPVKGGYNFAGWFTSPTTGTQILPDSQVIFTVEHTLFAKWEKADENFDTSGDFGKTLGMNFLSQNSDAPVSLNVHKDIVDYCAGFGLNLPLKEQAQYVGLYRSHDIFVTLSQVDTVNSGKPVRYFVFDLYVRNIENLFTQTVGKRRPVEELIASGEKYAGGSVIAAINGDYTGNRNHCLVALRNGQMYFENDFLQSDICVMYYDGTMETVTPSEYNWQEIEKKIPYQIWDFGPELLSDSGKALTSFNSSAYDSSVIGSRHPRSGLGYFQPGHYCFVSVDGRSDVSKGLTMKDFAKLFEELGCVQAYNMDGGDSSQSYYQGEMVRVADRDGGEQRYLYDIICVGEVKKES